MIPNMTMTTRGETRKFSKKYICTARAERTQLFYYCSPAFDTAKIKTLQKNKHKRLLLKYYRTQQAANCGHRPCATRVRPSCPCAAAPPGLPSPCLSFQIKNTPQTSISRLTLVHASLKPKTNRKHYIELRMLSNYSSASSILGAR